MGRNLETLATNLREELETIVDRWMRHCDADDELEVVSRLSRSEFRNNIPAAIEGLCRALSASSLAAACKSIKEEVAKHGHHRWKQGFSLRQLIRDWGHLNRVLVEMVQEHFEGAGGEASRHRAEALGRLAVFLTEAASSSVRRFDDLRRAEAASLARDLRIAQDEFEHFTVSRARMLREAAHDIRGSLASIAGATEVLKITSTEDHSLGELIDGLEEGVASVRGMLNSLLDLSRLESGADALELMEVNIADVLEKLASQYGSLADERGIELRHEGPPELCVRTDPAKVRRIAQNLLVNALQYTSRGWVKLSWEAKPDVWLLRVSDTGPGVQDILGSPVARELNDHDEDHTPGPGGSQAYPGEGIGLTIVKRLCSLLDAGITLDSRLGVGSTFEVEFPRDYPSGTGEGAGHGTA